MESSLKTSSNKRSGVSSDGTSAPKRKRENATDGNNNSEDKMVGDSPGVFRVWDRRINSHLFDESTSLYAVLRAWVQDDPDRPLCNQPPAGAGRGDRKPGHTEYDSVIAFLRARLTSPEQRIQESCQKEEEGGSEECVNSLDGIRTQDLLSLHILHSKKVQGMCRMLAAAKYGRQRALEAQKLRTTDQSAISVVVIPPSETMESLLSLDESQDFSLSRLQKQLQLREEQPPCLSTEGDYRSEKEES